MKFNSSSHRRSRNTIIRENPPLPDDKIIACLRDTYGLTATAIEFLALGNDTYAAVYRVSTDDEKVYFLKVKRDTVYAPSILVPRYLKDQGIEQVVSPLATITGELWGQVDHFSLILYPFIDGVVAMDTGLSDSQWIEFGTVVKNIHATRLSPELLVQVRQEDFVPTPKLTSVVKQLQAEVQSRAYDDPFQRELAAFWREKHAEIGMILDRAETLGRILQNRPSTLVLCHADIHTANLLLGADDKLFVVDWDQPVIAPKERDLMFIVGGTVGGVLIGHRQQELFLRGYGKTDVDALALAYYRYEWVVQEIGDYGERVFLTDDVSADTKRRSAQGFRSLFAPDDVVDVAHKLDHILPVS